MTVQHSRRVADKPVSPREQFVIDKAITGTLDALGINDAAEVRTLWPKWMTMLNWFETMQAKDKARMEAWHKFFDLISRAGVEEGVKWTFRTIALVGTLLVTYAVTHHFALSSGLLEGILGAG